MPQLSDLGSIYSVCIPYGASYEVLHQLQTDLFLSTLTEWERRWLIESAVELIETIDASRLYGAWLAEPTRPSAVNISTHLITIPNCFETAQEKRALSSGLVMLKMVLNSSNVYGVLTEHGPRVWAVKMEPGNCTEYSENAKSLAHWWIGG